ncbi:hypothetical protein A0H81_12170 [Grifola frondosa]|uniref:Uncharacterized protein n=1 Tax=Grifola frondosa TaxID=5627 RepID=A0A1C7LT46_GRIFR|nr:hypothetical protein A0H81_12170 [Grifola frondosa]
MVPGVGNFSDKEASGFDGPSQRCTRMLGAIVVDPEPRFLAAYRAIHAGKSGIRFVLCFCANRRDAT